MKVETLQLTKLSKTRQKKLDYLSYKTIFSFFQLYVAKLKCFNIKPFAKKHIIVKSNFLTF